MSNIVNLADYRAARLNKRAAVFGLEVRRDGDVWVLIGPDAKVPELVGTLADIDGDLAHIERQALIPNDDIVIGH